MVKERGKFRMGFTPAISQKNIARITDELRKLKIHRWVHFSLIKIAELLKAEIRGWLNYYAKFRKSELRKLFRVVNLRLAKWVRNKYWKFRRRHWFLAYKYLQGIAQSYPNMFEHWKHGFDFVDFQFSPERRLYHEEPYESRRSLPLPIFHRDTVLREV